MEKREKGEPKEQWALGLFMVIICIDLVLIILLRRDTKGIVAWCVQILVVGLYDHWRETYEVTVRDCSVMCLHCGCDFPTTEPINRKSTRLFRTLYLLPNFFNSFCKFYLLYSYRYLILSLLVSISYREMKLKGSCIVDK